MKPIVDGIESEFKDNLRVIRVDIQSSLADRFNGLVTPTFIFFSADGKEQWRSIGRLDHDQVSESVNASR
jgi:thiol:disulfide interchange protein